MGNCLSIPTPSAQQTQQTSSLLLRRLSLPLLLLKLRSNHDPCLACFSSPTTTKTHTHSAIRREEAENKTRVGLGTAPTVIFPCHFFTVMSSLVASARRLGLPPHPVFSSLGSLQEHSYKAPPSSSSSSCSRSLFLSGVLFAIAVALLLHGPVF